MNFAWLMRMARWARRPPSAAQVKFVLVVLAICGVLVAIQYAWGWPDWLRVNGPARIPRHFN